MVAKARVKKDPKGKRMKRAVKRELLPSRQNHDMSDATDVEEADDDYGDYSFLLSSQFVHDLKASTKRHWETEDGEYNSEPRTNFGVKSDQESHKLKFLLPVKSDEGVQMRYQQIETIFEPESVKVSRKTDGSAEISEVNAKQEPEWKTFSGDINWKTRVAGLAFDVLENPESNLRCVRELLSGLSEPKIDSVIYGAIMATLVEIFKDILPGYRVHIVSETEKDQKVRKETLTLRQHEQALLLIYQKFLQVLEKTVAVIYSRQAVPTEDLNKALVAGKCMSELMLNHMNFNFRRNLAFSLVNLGTSRIRSFQELSAKSLHNIFRQDLSGDATYDAVNCISIVAKERSHKLNRKLLDCLVHVKIDKELLAEIGKKSKKDRKVLSKAERKRQKEVAKVEKELQASQIEENRKVKARLHSQTLQALFAIFFRIMRRADDRVRLKLLPSVLMGVAKFAHLINIELVDDLVASINQIIQSTDCGVLETLFCVKTVFSIVSQEGYALNIDPQRFYEHLFSVMNALKGTENRQVFVELIFCVQKGFIERKKLISLDRAARCSKGLISLALRVNAKECTALLLLTKNILLAHPRLDFLLDAETIDNPVAPHSVGDPMSPGPLWGLHMLHRHHDPSVRALSDKLMGKVKVLGGDFAVLMKITPLEFLEANSV